MSTIDWRIRITETAHKAGFQPDAAGSGALICTLAVIENFARAIERQALERAAIIAEGHSVLFATMTAELIAKEIRALLDPQSKDTEGA